ncbi:hypothetical protein RB195_004894 [Necator americanus]
MSPHPSYPCGYYSDHNRHHYQNHPPVTSRRCLPYFLPRRNDARPYPPPPSPLINDSFFWSGNIPKSLDRPSFAKVAASSKGSRAHTASGSLPTNSVPQLPSKHPQLPKCLTQALTVVVERNSPTKAHLVLRLNSINYLWPSESGIGSIRATTDSKAEEVSPPAPVSEMPVVFRSPLPSRPYNQFPFHRRSLPISYETTPCEFWRRGEMCRFGANCWYAHGSVPLHQNQATNENRVLTGDTVNSQNADPNLQEQTVESAMNQFTPEQQQWMYLSQRAQTFFPYPQNLIAARLKELAQKTGTAGEVSIPGRTCEEIEREQTASRLHTATAQRADSLPSSSGSCSSGPTTPAFGNIWLPTLFDEPLVEKAASYLRDIVSSMTSDSTDLFLIPFGKEECTLYRCGQCPFGSFCFFEHPGEEDEGIYSDS